ncbi:putative urea ABC transporter substrate-binding protein [Hyphomicrobium sp.]|uniref:putative urea ABC transporter substrate-binding protein n=1 Tax=Hyphomicrobium sp. TaxID=82 RepID=UPI002D797FE5|nr:putative urea ABC transporter substrate-binding protein [Hyphomicrobium sp.]HET6387959.1 putative urea ABC transporter substrate-binding protein [Hyphomicrobium sp.]
MTKRSILTTVLCTAAIVVCAGAAHPARAEETFKVAWSIYTGYLPWPYAQHAGILEKWAKKYGIKIELVQVNDYVESINQYTGGKADAVAATTMDALTIPAAGGVDTTIAILGDYSNGNDGIVLKGENKTFADLKGKKINLVQYSISHYMLARAFEANQMTIDDSKLRNVSDADFVAAFQTADVDAVVAWNPGFMELKKQPGVSVVYQSGEMPGELVDALLVNTKVLKDHPEFGKALTGAWFETLAVIKGDDEKGKEARKFMAELSGTTVESLNAQIETTAFYYDPAEGAKAIRSPDMVTAMDLVRTFSFNNQLMGNDAKSKDAIGIELPGKTLGDTSNVKLRFDDTFMQLAADNKL